MSEGTGAFNNLNCALNYEPNHEKWESGCSPCFYKGVDITEEKFVSQYDHEAETARLERIIKRLWILVFVIFISMLIALIGSNLAWVHYEHQFEDSVVTEQTVTQDNSNGTNNFVGGDVNGTSDS